MSHSFSATVVVLIVGVVAHRIWTPIRAGGDPSPRSLCLSNVRQDALALAMYASDYDGRFPDARRWMDSCGVYAGSSRSFRCPAATSYGYAFNEKLSLAQAPGVPAPLVFDSALPFRNAVGLRSLPVPGRHEGRNSDGHAKSELTP